MQRTLTRMLLEDEFGTDVTNRIEEFIREVVAEMTHVHNSDCCNRIDDHKRGVPHSCNGL